MQFRQCSVDGVVYVQVDEDLCVQSDVPGVASTPLSSLTVCCCFLTLYEMVIKTVKLLLQLACIKLDKITQL